MKPEDDKTRRAVNEAVDEVLGDGQNARALKQALHDRLDPKRHKAGDSAPKVIDGDETDLFDNLPV